MSSSQRRTVTPDPWHRLRQFTDARIALGRTGSSLPLAASLQFKLAHAKARDAVWQPADLEGLAAQLIVDGHRALTLTSRAAGRDEYLTRPDKGRTLSRESLSLLEQQPKDFDCVLVVCDGLSAPAIDQHGLAVTTGLLEVLTRGSLRLAPVCLVRNGRVAIGDQVAHTMRSQLVVVLIGERPGLSSPNSLGAYITYAAQPGTTDEARNCVSNIRTGGLAPAEGVRKIAYLIEMANHLRTTGVSLKDNMPVNYLPFGGSRRHLP